MKKPSENWENSATRRLAQILKTIPKFKKDLPIIKKQPPPLKVDLFFISEKKMIELNAHYRNKKTVTDVLSFPAQEIFYDTGYLGEIVICYPVLARQAKERNLSIDMELMILLVHGALHLCGLDHEKNKKEFLKMADLESKIIKNLVPRAWIQKSNNACLYGLLERLES